MAKLQTSPGNAHPHSRLCPPHLRPSFPYRYRTLKTFAFSSSLHASYAISVRRASALPAASFRFHLTMDTLAVRLTVPPVGSVGDFHSLVSAPCRAHKVKERPDFSSGRSFCFTSALNDPGPEQVRKELRAVCGDFIADGQSQTGSAASRSFVPLISDSLARSCDALHSPRARKQHGLLQSGRDRHGSHSCVRGCIP